MARKCAVCGKGPSFGHNVSQAHKKTIRRWYPNLQTVRTRVGGEVKRLRVCTACIRSNRIVKA